MATSRLRALRPIPPYELAPPKAAEIQIEGVDNRVFVEHGYLPPAYVHRLDGLDAHIVRQTEQQAIARTQQLAAKTLANNAGATPSHAAATQAVLNSGGTPAHAAIADAVAAASGRAVVAVPPAYAGSPAYVDAHLAQSSVQAYWWPPTAVSAVTPITAAAHAVSIAATAATRTI